MSSSPTGKLRKHAKIFCCILIHIAHILEVWGSHTHTPVLVPAPAPHFSKNDNQKKSFRLDFMLKNCKMDMRCTSPSKMIYTDIPTHIFQDYSAPDCTKIAAAACCISTKILIRSIIDGPN